MRLLHDLGVTHRGKTSNLRGSCNKVQSLLQSQGFIHWLQYREQNPRMPRVGFYYDYSSDLSDTTACPKLDASQDGGNRGAGAAQRAGRSVGRVHRRHPQGVSDHARYVAQTPGFLVAFGGVYFRFSWKRWRRGGE